MGFADILNTFKKPERKDNGGVLAKQDRYILSLNGDRLKGKPENRAENCFHPSSLSTSSCIRMMVYGWLKAEATNGQTVTPKARRIFDVGHHFGYIQQQYYWDMGILEGKYHCVKCGEDWWGISPRECPSCRTKLEIWYNLHYKEVPIKNKAKNIIGHADGIIILDGKRVLIELKSIKNRDVATSDSAITFDDLSEAKLDHKYQASMYMDALDSKFGEGFIDRALIIYMAKNTQDQKEYSIRKLPMFLEPSYVKIDSVNHALENKYLPERAGTKKSDMVCRYCPFKDLCWGAEHTFEQVDNRKVAEA